VGESRPSAIAGLSECFGAYAPGSPLSGVCVGQSQETMAWVARLSHVFHELRVVYNARDAASAGVRQFLEEYYSFVKELNPGLPVYVRPFDGVREPYVAVRRSDGSYATRQLTNLSARAVLRQIKELTDVALPLDPVVRRRQLADII
jgi:hypothetical protein